MYILGVIILTKKCFSFKTVQIKNHGLFYSLLSIKKTLRRKVLLLRRFLISNDAIKALYVYTKEDFLYLQ